MNEVTVGSNENIAKVQQSTEDIDCLLDAFWHIFHKVNSEKTLGISEDKVAEIAMEMVKIYYSEI